MNAKSKKAVIGVILAVVFILLAAVLPTSEEVSRVGLYSLFIFFAAIALWICDSMPMCISAFACMFLLTVFGIFTNNDVFNAFGGTSFFFAIATFAVSIALENTSIPLRICHGMVKLAKGKPERLVIMLYLTTAIVSGIMSNLSTCIIFMNLSLALLRANKCEPLKSNLGKCLMIGIPCVAGCGGMITPAGTPGNTLIIQLLSSVGIDITFLQWVAIFAPLAIISVLLLGFWSVKIWKPEEISEEAMNELNSKLEQSGSLKTKEIKTLVVIIAMLFFWVLGTWIPVFDVTRVAIFGMVILFLPGIGVLEWKDTASRINWNLSFTLGTVGVLISGMTSTGIMAWLVNKMFSGINGWNVIVMFFVLGLAVCVIRAFIPTAPAIAALFGAPMLALAPLASVSPVALLLLPAFWACTPTLLWIEPIFLFSYGYGYYKPQDVLKFGSVPTAILIVLMSFTTYYVGMFGF